MGMPFKKAILTNRYFRGHHREGLQNKRIVRISHQKLFHSCDVRRQPSRNRLIRGIFLKQKLQAFPAFFGNSRREIIIFLSKGSTPIPNENLSMPETSIL